MTGVGKIKRGLRRAMGKGKEVDARQQKKLNLAVQTHGKDVSIYKERLKKYDDRIKRNKEKAASDKKLDKQLKNATNMTRSKKAKAVLGTVRKKLSSKRKSNLQPHWPGFAESD